MIQVAAQTMTPPRVFIVNGKKMLESRTAYLSGDKKVKYAVQALIKEGNKALKFAPVSIMDKEQTPPSGDKHDYISLAAYWFPDPKSPNGLPYIRNDGVRNPEVKNYKDHDNLSKMCDVVFDASVAYYFSSEEKYAEHAVTLIRVWFLDEATKMNPNMKYAQAVLGRNDGRGSGVLDARDLKKIVDAVGLLEGSQSLKKDEGDGLRLWMTQYFQWITESKNGKDERDAKNNHGTWYDVQAVSIALFLGKIEYAKERCESAKERRIAFQIQPDGTQPEELARTKAISYSEFNLQALLELSLLAENIGIDLWNYTGSHGRGIRKALDYIIPYITKEKETIYKQIDEIKSDNFVPALYVASLKYNDGTYLSAIAKISEKELNKNSFVVLF